jgi:tetratricopeptide (TPR) repeat protein
MLGLVALQSSRFDESLRLLEQSVAAGPPVAGYLGNLGAAYRTAGRPADAIPVLDRAIGLEPLNASLHYNRALALVNLGRLEEAAAGYRRCLEINGDNTLALNNLGDLERELGALDDAQSRLDKALKIEPNYIKAHYNRSLVLLSQGRLREGFSEYEWRLKASEFQPRNFQQEKWDGSPLGDKTLLVYAEQGWGDTLQFIRFLPLVAHRCRHVIVEVPKSMQPLLAGAGFENLVTQDSALPPFDVQVSLASLPHVFDTTLETIPADVPYLKAHPRLLDAWHEELAGYDGFKVGIVWQGRPTFGGDRYRSIPLSCFAPLAEVPGVRLFSLQKGPGIEQIPALQRAFEVVDLGSRVHCDVGDFMDTAAAMKNLDLVVSADTSCAHLAGGLGVPVWVALRFAAEWRWMRDRTDSPWYPTMRLFRQPTFGDWPGVFRSIARELQQHVNAQSG